MKGASAPRRGIWWAKRDLRLADNDALLAAIDACDELLVLYVVEPSLVRAEDVSALQYHAWGQATGALRDAVEGIGGAFHLAVGEVVDVLEALRSDDGFDALYAHEEIGAGITYARDRAVRAWCGRCGIPFAELPQSGVIRGLKDRDTRQPIIRARLVETEPRPAPVRIPAWRPSRACAAWPGWTEISGRPWPREIRTGLLQPVTEADGRATLDTFLGARGIEYSGGISSPNSAFDAGSRLSAHIAWGTTSLRTIHRDTAERMGEAKASDAPEARRWTRSLRAFGARLHWHDHFSQRLESAPDMEFSALNEAHRALEYPDDPALLDAWCEGRTGHPMVDAAVRCLRATGFMNFRMRAMLVSVACHGLELSWRSIQYPCARMFRDYEPGIPLRSGPDAGRRRRHQHAAGVQPVQAARGPGPGRGVRAPLDTRDRGLRREDDPRLRDDPAGRLPRARDRHPRGRGARQVAHPRDPAHPGRRGRGGEGARAARLAAAAVGARGHAAPRSSPGDEEEDGEEDGDEAGDDEEGSGREEDGREEESDREADGREASRVTRAAVTRRPGAQSAGASSLAAPTSAGHGEWITYVGTRSR